MREEIPLPRLRRHPNRQTLIERPIVVEERAELVAELGPGRRGRLGQGLLGWENQINSHKKNQIFLCFQS